MIILLLKEDNEPIPASHAVAEYVAVDSAQNSKKLILIIKKLSQKNAEEIASVINEASKKYKPVAKSYKYPLA